MSSLRPLENVLLAPFTTLGIGGPARYFTEASDEREVLAALEFAHAHSLSLFILGGGSNILISDSGFPGLVLRINIRGISVEDNRQGIVKCGAGEQWDPLVRWSAERNWAGAENLSGIPGTVGGTPIQNVGAYGQEVSEIIESVRAVDRTNQEIVYFSNAECGFAYRGSIFNTSSMNRFVVLEVTYRFRVGGAARLDYPELRAHFAGKNLSSLSEVRDAVRALRASKAMLLSPGDPDCQSAGSFFKNPVVTEEDYARIQERARSIKALDRDGLIPRFNAPSDGVKMPAAWLIEHAGFHKGYERGRVGISTKHALAIVNRGGATASELLSLFNEIREGVRIKFGVTLAPEPAFVGFDPPNSIAECGLPISDCGFRISD